MNRATAAHHNRQTVLHLLAAQSPLSQLQIARLTQLRPSTVSYIIQDLKKLELIRESGVVPATRAGPKETLLEICPKSAWSVGLDLDPAGPKLCLINAAGHIVAQHMFPIYKDFNRFARELSPLIKEYSATLHLDPEKGVGLGVSVPGIVNPETGEVLISASQKWQNFPLGALLKEHVGPLVYVERDATCGAYAERYVGRARNCDHFLYILLHPKWKEPGRASQSYAYGLAFVMDGRVYRGCNYAAGELDEMLTPEPIRREVRFDPDTTAEEARMNEFLESLGRTVGSLANLLDPEVVILCANGQLFTRERLARVETTARAAILNVAARRFSLTSSAVGVNALPYGAALACLHQGLQGRLQKPEGEPVVSQ